MTAERDELVAALAGRGVRVNSSYLDAEPPEDPPGEDEP